MATAAEKEALRGGIESTHNKLRADREKEYTDAKVTLQEEFQSDIRDIERTKQEALVAAGLNPDGSDPQGRQQGSVD